MRRLEPDDCREAAIIGLRANGCNCDPELNFAPLKDGWRFTHKHDPDCRFVLMTGMVPDSLGHGKMEDVDLGQL